MNDKYQKLLSKVKKYYKNTNLICDIYLENYHNFYLYIRLDYYKKLKCYRISWIDLAHLESYSIESSLSYEFFSNTAFERLEQLSKDIKIAKSTHELTDEYTVTINNYLKDNQFNTVFHRYIPKETAYLFNYLIVIFDHLPVKLSGFLTEMSEEINGKKNKYEYRETYNFDLFNDDLTNVFSYEIVGRGKQYYEENRVFFLEKIKDTYYAVVGGQELYVIEIMYNEKQKRMSGYCSCPCEFPCKHLVAVIKSIRDNKFRNFYKLTHKDSLLDKVMNFNCILSIGIDDQGNNYLILEDGQIKLLSIKNKDGISEWEILEDDEKETLTKRLKEILK